MTRFLSILLIAFGIPFHGWTQIEPVESIEPEPSQPIRAGGEPEETWEISLEDAVATAIENNLQIRIQSVAPMVSDSSLKQAQAAYIPVLSGRASTRTSTSPGSFDPDTGIRIDPNTQESDSSGFNVNGVLSTGANYSFGVNAVGREGTFVDDESRKYQGSFNFNITQPILRNAWIDATRRSILVAKKNLRISDAQFELQVQNIVSQVESSYYDLVAALENVVVQEKALELAESTRNENRLRVQYGAMAPLDEKQAESQVATSRATLLNARQSVVTAENALKRLLTDDYLSVYEKRIEPTAPLIPKKISFDTPKSWAAGLTRRPEMTQLRLQLERQNIEVKFAKNQMFPQVDLNASFGVNGLQSSYTRLYDQFIQGDARDKSVGIVISIPLSNRAERERLRSVKWEKERLLMTLKDQEQAIQIEIDNAINQARASFEQVAATREARQFAEEALVAEQKKLEEGISTSFVVLQLQRDLTARRYDEIQAIANYQRALTSLAVAEGTILDRHNIVLTGNAESFIANDN